VSDGIFRASKALLQKCDIITNYCLRGTQTGEDVFFENFDNNFVVIGLSRHIFYPFGDVIYAIKMNWLPNEFENGPMKSMSQTSKFSNSRIGFKGIMYRLKIFPVLTVCT